MRLTEKGRHREIFRPGRRLVEALLRVGLGICILFTTASCRTAHFYAQAAAGQWEIRMVAKE